MPKGIFTRNRAASLDDARNARELVPRWLALLAWSFTVAALPAPAQSARDQAVAKIAAAHAAATRERPARSLPIGVFDSGTGGLAVLEQLLRLDCFDNDTHAPNPRGDGRPDFQAEQFVFLGDQANMPYGNYPALGKRSCLVDLALNDAVFLLGCEYHPGAKAATPARDKPPAKSIVIACNTATAYGETEIRNLIRDAQVDVKVFGIIAAGARGVIEMLPASGDATVGVLATRGTCESGAYPAAIQALARQRGQEIVIVQKGSLGLAGAIDGIRDFILPNPSSPKPRLEYRGPSLTNAQDRIEKTLLARYGFDFSQNRMLWEGDPAQPTALQVNSVENYIAFEAVGLVEQLRRQPPRRPLSVVVMGCTHFPFYADVLAQEFRRLRDYKENGQYIYRGLLAPDIHLIDPAVVAGRQLYATLAANNELNVAPQPGAPACRGRFFITVPNPTLPAACLDAGGGFAYDYKYGRTSVLGTNDFLAVPLTRAYFDAATSLRLQRQLPAVWSLLEIFSAELTP